RTDGGAPPPRAARLTARASLGRDRRLALEVALEVPGAARRTHRLEATAARPLAVELARWIAAAVAPPGGPRPHAGDLAEACTDSPEAWRLWRRARRASRMQRWGAVRELTAKAIELDPDFSLAHLELAFSYMKTDAALMEA